LLLQPHTGKLPRPRFTLAQDSLMIKTLMLAVLVICANTARAGDSEDLTAADVAKGLAEQWKMPEAKITVYPSYPSSGSIILTCAQLFGEQQQTKLPPVGTPLFPMRLVRDKIFTHVSGGDPNMQPFRSILTIKLIVYKDQFEDWHYSILPGTTDERSKP
jgi:hypothetical protein